MSPRIKISLPPRADRQRNENVVAPTALVERMPREEDARPPAKRIKRTWTVKLIFESTSKYVVVDLETLTKASEFFNELIRPQVRRKETPIPRDVVIVMHGVTLARFQTAMDFLQCDELITLKMLDFPIEDALNKILALMNHVGPVFFRYGFDSGVAKVRADLKFCFNHEKARSIGDNTNFIQAARMCSKEKIVDPLELAGGYLTEWFKNYHVQAPYACIVDSTLLSYEIGAKDALDIGLNTLSAVNKEWWRPHKYDNGAPHELEEHHVEGLMPLLKAFPVQLLPADFKEEDLNNPHLFKMCVVLKFRDLQKK